MRPFPEGGFLLPLLGGALKFLAPLVLPGLVKKVQEVAPAVVTGAFERLAGPRAAPRELEEETAEEAAGADDIDAMLDAMSDEELEDLAAEEGLIAAPARGPAGGVMRKAVMPSVGLAVPLAAGGILPASPDVRSAQGIRTVGATTAAFSYPDLGLRMKMLGGAIFER